MPTAVIYSREGCQPCRMTKRACEEAGYRVLVLSVEDWETEYHTHFPDSRELPGVCIHDVHDKQLAKWTGFRPDLIRQYKG